MRHGLALAALLLPLTGCVVAPQPVGYGYYAQPGYPGAYPQPGYPGPYAQTSDYDYPGFAYNDGSPTLFVEGSTVPLIFFDGGWGYYDGARRWHRAPGRVESRLNERFPGGAGFRPWGGGRPDAFRPEGARPGGFRPEGVRPEGFRPEGFRPGGFRPGGFRPEERSEGFRPDAIRPGGFRPEGGRPEGFRPEGPHVGGNPGGGFRPQVQAPAPAAVQRAAAPAARPEGAPQRHREDEHH